MEDPDTIALRRAVRAHLAERPAVSQSSETLHRHLRREHACTLADVEKALAVLCALGQLKSSHDPLGGSTLYYRATADGILSHERSE
jgi:hypothetical protein